LLLLYEIGVTKQEYDAILHTKYLTHTHTHNRFTALWNLSGKTRVSRYQKKHSPTTLIVVINLNTP